MASIVEVPQNVVVRVTNLPFLSTAYDMMTSVYGSTKENHPYLKSLCEVAEKGVTVVSSVAITSATPILQKLEPQIAFANGYACKGLDRIEEKLPFLHQPTDQVVSKVKEIVTHTVTGTRETVANKITGVVDKTKDTVHESIEITKAVVNGSMNYLVESRMGKALSIGVNSALNISELLVDHYLPLTEDEQATEENKGTNGFEIDPLKLSHFERLGSLSTKVRKRTYQQAVVKVHTAKQRGQEAISQLHHTINLIEYARENMGTANKKIHDAQDKLYHTWIEWRKSNLEHEDHESCAAEQAESRTLAIAWNLSQQLQTTCFVLVSSVWGLPQNVQEQVQYINLLAREMYSTFKSKTSFRELSSQILSTSKDQLTKMKDSLDGLMDYLVNNTPLNWLVGPFYPQLTGSQ
ncbi:perilipin-2 isoform X2 [Stegostoma tigrinum]|uniref:perilipin-2 isoform X2 n=1 Tax=Stegostoma tigrinum TaxID=3053191 RepID=UPI00202AD130|nr:perilipin-2 isoform X2 [Stegostoma tigrinum]XP_048384256.1 perilipin-2 isoform X2 [Stegostoma tigrinum]XP_059499721.1 perilipin-2 isoform X2 [Stegostoma tigrinum]